MDIAKLSNLVVTTLGEDEDIEDDTVEIPLPNVKATVLAKVIEYCTHYKQVEPSKLYCNIICKHLIVDYHVIIWGYVSFVDLDNV